MNILFYVRSCESRFSYDNAAQVTTIDFNQYDINAKNTAPASPNMNAFTERVIGTIRREALDHFLLISEKQVHKIIKKYVDYYNKYRTHQGINRVPNGFCSSNHGKIKMKSILGGLHNHYYRSSA
ncbi:MAG: integrase core domain-containing protein [Spirochaetaceae bacterium]|jgi:transposase InsO family protein|nr:integrase core domain-containing protein [Spirochaetaceae bacterium]